MAEILQGIWQIVDRSGKKIILLSPLSYAELNQATTNVFPSWMSRKNIADRCIGRLGQ